MKFKWYIEFPIVLTMIILGTVFAWNANLSSCSKKSTGDKVTAAKNDDSKTSPDEIRWHEGKDLYKANCVACHNPKTNGAGPALKGAAARWKAAGSYQGKTGEQWMKIWIRNWNDVVKADYKYGVDMANSRPAQMNIFPYLTDEQIDKIMFYVESSDGLKPAVAAK